MSYRIAKAGLPLIHAFAVLASLALAAPAQARAVFPAPVGFYAPWDPQSLKSLQDHGGALSVVAPAWLSVTGPDHALVTAADPAGHAAIAALRPRPRLWIVLQNARLGAWDGAGAAVLLKDPVARTALLDRLEQTLAAEHADGLVVDFENLPADAQPGLRTFLAETLRRCRRHRWTLTVTAPAANPDWDVTTLSSSVDAVILMAYDEHWQSGAPGPIAGTDWFQAVVSRAGQLIPHNKLIVAVAAYAYDWPQGGVAKVLSIPDAEALAARVGQTPQTDPASGELHLAYTQDGAGHDLWIVPADTLRTQMAAALAAGAVNTALWRLGTEPSGLWATALPAAPR